LAMAGCGPPRHAFSRAMAREHPRLVRGLRVLMLRNREQGAECRDAWHSRVFWVLAVAFFLVSVVTSGCLVHLVPLLTDRGASGQSAAFAASFRAAWCL
jgi:hypothetical protein